MAFKTDGSSHSNGIKNEELIVKILNKKYSQGIDVLKLKSNPLFKCGINDFVFVHSGGTSTTSDINIYNINDRLISINISNIIDKSVNIYSYFNKIVSDYKDSKDTLNIIDKISQDKKDFKNIQFYLKNTEKTNYFIYVFSVDDSIDSGISVKRHYSGTIDLKNTSSQIPGSVDFTRLNEFSTIVKNDSDVKSSKNTLEEKYREMYYDACNDCFREDASEVVKKIDEWLMKTKYILITFNDDEGKINEGFLINNSNSQAKFNKYSKYEFRSVSAKQSRRIYKDDEKTPFRLRILLNNGLSPLAGLSKANNNSTPVLKIQIDDIEKFIEIYKGVKIELN